MFIVFYYLARFEKSKFFVNSRLIEYAVFAVLRYNSRIQSHYLRMRIIVTGEEPDYYIARKYSVDCMIEDVPFCIFVKIEGEKNRCDQQNSYDKQRHGRLPKYSTCKELYSILVEFYFEIKKINS